MSDPLDDKAGSMKVHLEQNGLHYLPMGKYQDQLA